MSECLVIAQTTAQGAFESGHRGQETVVRRTSAQDLPKPLNHLELGAVTWQPVPLQMWHVVEACGDQGAFVPGGVVDDQHHTRIAGSRIGACQIPPMPGERRWQGALPQRGSLPLHDSRAQVTSHQIQRPKTSIASWPSPWPTMG
jgi:hypothetical protein